MAAHGNPDPVGNLLPGAERAGGGYPEEELYICERDGKVCGVFAFPIGEDPTYEKMEGGGWLSDAPYGTIHRMAGKETERGIFEECLSWCREQIGHIRIDTHEDNRIMRHLIEKNGFVRCGIIHVADGSPRIAYEWIRRRKRTMPDMEKAVTREKIGTARIKRPPFPWLCTPCYST